jgi:hypothetical protein
LRAIAIRDTFVLVFTAILGEFGTLFTRGASPIMKKNSRTARTRKLSVETLERREVFAGNITTTLIGGTLRLIGDNQANVAVLTAGPGGNQVTLTGTATQIDGVLAPKTFDNVRNIVVELRGGDDSFAVGATITSADPLALIGTPLTLTGTLSIKGENGDDQIGVLVAGTVSTSIDGGFGDDQIGARLSTTRTTFDVTGGSGAGEDQIFLGKITAADLTVNGDAGIDEIDFINSTANRVTVKGGDETDLIFVSNVDPRTSLIVDGEGGDDLLQVDNVDTVLMTVWGRDGDDNIAIDNANITTTLKVDVGEGDNTLTVENSTANVAFFIGGLGENFLTETNNTFNRKRLVNVS